MTDSPNPPARPTKAARQAAIATSLIQGYSVTRIADTLGYSARHISRDLKEMEARFRQQASQDIRLAKGIDLERLDALLSYVWPQCEQGYIPSIRVAIELIARRARLLGTDAPHQLVQTVDDHGDPASPAHLTGLTDAEALAIYRQVIAAVPQAESGARAGYNSPSLGSTAGRGRNGKRLGTGRPLGVVAVRAEAATSSVYPVSV